MRKKPRASQAPYGKADCQKTVRPVGRGDVICAFGGAPRCTAHRADAVCGKHFCSPSIRPQTDCSRSRLHPQITSWFGIKQSRTDKSPCGFVGRGDVICAFGGAPRCTAHRADAVCGKHFCSPSIRPQTDCSRSRLHPQITSWFGIKQSRTDKSPCGFVGRGDVI